MEMLTAAAEADTGIVIEENDENEAGTTSPEWDGTIASRFAGGSGTENDPFQISNGEELMYLSYMVSKGTYYDGKYFVLTQNILLNDGFDDEPKSWVPICCKSDEYFNGTFDGDGHQVIGLYRNDTSGSHSDYRGLFGQIGPSGVVKNVGVTKGRINGYGLYVGGICGVNKGRISGCYNLNSITSSTSYDYYGGICGKNDGVIENCYNKGELYFTDQKDYIGGVCGINYGTISECYNTGRVYTTNSTYYVGGVCGLNSDTVKDCYNLGEVNGDRYVGGVCGSNDDGTVMDSFNKGEVTGRVALIGGVCGFSGSRSATDTILRCYNLGSVICTNSVNDGGSTGGVCGWLDGYLIKQCYNFGTVDAYYQTAGVCGRINRGEVSESFNAGTVNGSMCVGGIAGYVIGCAVGPDGVVSGHAIIKNCYNTGDIIGDNTVGGVWAYSDRSIFTEMANCYNTGDVTGSSELYPVGYNVGQISNVYYDSNECECSSTNNSDWAKTTKQLTASTAISDLGFDSNLWSKTANTDSYWYYPDLANINDDQPRVMAQFILSAPVISSAVNNNGQISLTWNAVEGATKYKVQYRLNGTTEWTEKETTSTSYTVTGLTNGKKYDFLVLAGNEAGWSEYTDENIVNATPVNPITVAPPSFVVKGVFGGRNVTFNCDTPGATIYYTTENRSVLKLTDPHVAPGETVLFTAYYGTVYARAYCDGKWSNPARLILKIPKVNTPTITKLSNGKYKIKTTTPGTIVYYTIDGTTPSATNYKGKFWTSHDVSIPAGKTVKAIAVRTCFSDSDVATAKT